MVAVHGFRSALSLLSGSRATPQLYGDKADGDTTNANDKDTSGKEELDAYGYDRTANATVVNCVGQGDTAAGKTDATASDKSNGMNTTSGDKKGGISLRVRGGGGRLYSHIEDGERWEDFMGLVVFYDKARGYGFIRVPNADGANDNSINEDYHPVGDYEDDADFFFHITDVRREEFHQSEEFPDGIHEGIVVSLDTYYQADRDAWRADNIGWVPMLA